MDAGGGGAGPLVLGIDVGTTSLGVQLLCEGAAVYSASRDTGAATVHSGPGARDGGAGAGVSADLPHAEQDPGQIVGTLDALLRAVPEALRLRVAQIGLTGQMHGCMLWGPRTATASDESAGGGSTTQLATWEDQRCSDAFLARIGGPASPSPVKSGYGWATLCWYAEERPETLAQFGRAGHIQDYLVDLLVGGGGKAAGLGGSSAGGAVGMDPTQAHSWGFFDLAALNWDLSGMEAGVRAEVARFTPRVVPTGTRLGCVGAAAAARWGLPAGASVHVPSGDHQAHVRAQLQRLPEGLGLDQVLFLNIGTSAQLTVVAPQAQVEGGDEAGSGQQTWEWRPYLEPGYRLATCASLNGGNALAHLVRSVQGWQRELGAPEAREEAIYEALLREGEARAGTTLSFTPRFHGERFDTGSRGAVGNIGMANFGLGDLTAALCRGMVDNLRDMMPARLLSPVRAVVGSGRGLARNPLLQRYVEAAFGVPLYVEPGAEAASGIASLVCCERT